MAGFEVVDPRYRDLYERAIAVLDADDRVQSVRAGGSIGAGTADTWSDLDLEVVTHAEHHDAFLADRDTWLAAITPTVFARTPIAPFIVNTRDGGGPDARHRGVVRAPRRSGRRRPCGTPSACCPPPSSRTSAPPSSTRWPSSSAAWPGPFITFLQREEHLRHLTGVPHLLGLLTTVFLAETGEMPPGKRWNGTYTEEQRAAVAELPPVSATREGLMAFGLGLAELLVTSARPLYERYDLEWPADLAGVTARRVQSELGVDVSAWLH